MAFFFYRLFVTKRCLSKFVKSLTKEVMVRWALKWKKKTVDNVVSTTHNWGCKLLHWWRWASYYVIFIWTNILINVKICILSCCINQNHWDFVCIFLNFWSLTSNLFWSFNNRNLISSNSISFLWLCVLCVRMRAVYVRAWECVWVWKA